MLASISTQLRNCVKVKVVILGSMFLIVLTLLVLQSCGCKTTLNHLKAQELCGRWGGHPGLRVPNSPYGLVDVKSHSTCCQFTTGELCESRGGRPGLVSLMVPTVSMDVKQLWTHIHTELRSCVKLEVAVLGSLPLIVPVVSVDVKQHWTGIHT